MMGGRVMGVDSGGVGGSRTPVHLTKWELEVRTVDPSSRTLNRSPFFPQPPLTLRTGPVE